MAEPLRLSDFDFELPPDHLADWEIPAIEVAVRVFLARNHDIPGYETDDLIDECAAKQGVKPVRANALKLELAGQFNFLARKR